MNDNIIIQILEKHKACRSPREISAIKEVLTVFRNEIQGKLDTFFTSGAHLYRTKIYAELWEEDHDE